MHTERIPRGQIPRALPTAHACLGRAVRDLRARCGLSQRQLAPRCGVHPSYVQAIERGRVDPTFHMLLRLGRGMGVEMPALMERYQRHMERYPEEP